MSEPFEPALLTVFYWFLVSVSAICGIMCWKIGRVMRPDHPAYRPPERYHRAKP